ncbi:MAG: hypothetical protein ABIN67_17500 [Ferruginibacter sp.]
MIKATTRTMMIVAVHIPALKIPPTISQPEIIAEHMTKRIRMDAVYFFILNY